MIQEEELQLPEFNSRILITTRRSRNCTLLLRECSPVRPFSVEKRLPSKLVTFFQLVRSLKVLWFPTSSSEKETMESSLEPLGHSLPSLLTPRMDLRPESSCHLVSERPSTASPELWLESSELEEETRSQFSRLEFNTGDTRPRERTSLLLLESEWTQSIIHTEVVTISTLVSLPLLPEDAFLVRRLVLLLPEELVFLEEVTRLSCKESPIDVKNDYYRVFNFKLIFLDLRLLRCVLSVLKCV